MGLVQNTKTALDETRMIVLGAQILIGFQFRAAFQPLFAQLPQESRALNGVALLLMIGTLALLVFPGPYHRIAQGGNASGEMQRVASRVAAVALMPFILSIGIDIGLVGERLSGPVAGWVAGIVTTMTGLFFWYGFGGWAARSKGHKERATADREVNQVERPALHERIDQMLTEARVVLPGAQALLGFQLAIVLTEAFEHLSPVAKLIHGASLLSVALCVMLLMVPPAYHRMVYAGQDSEDFLAIGSGFVTASTLPLALGLAGDVYVVGTQIAGSEAVGIVIATAVLILLIGLWLVLPLIVSQAARRVRKMHAQ